ncbi:MAG: hypothetical protein WBG92_19440 [Thiohalocapsa sp.]
MRPFKLTAMALAASGLLTAGAVSADALIDLTDDVWGLAGTTTPGPRTVGGVTLTASPTPLVFQGYDGPVGGPAGATLGNVFELDGIGVVDDEVSGSSQSLTVDLGADLTVTGLAFLDLYKTGNPPQSGSDGGAEIMQVQFFLNGGLVDTQEFTATDPNPPSFEGGYLQATGLSVFADQLVFSMAANTGRDDGVADAAVAGITTVPIPAAAWLFGSALVGMVGMGRRKLKKA